MPCTQIPSQISMTTYKPFKVPVGACRGRERAYGRKRRGRERVLPAIFDFTHIIWLRCGSPPYHLPLIMQCKTIVLPLSFRVLNDLIPRKNRIDAALYCCILLLTASASRSDLNSLVSPFNDITRELGIGLLLPSRNHVKVIFELSNQ